METWIIYFQNGEQKNGLFEINTYVGDDMHDPDSGYYTHIHIDVDLGNICRFVEKSTKMTGFDLEAFIIAMNKLTEYNNLGFPSTIDGIKNCEMRYEMAKTLYKNEIFPLISAEISSFSQKWGLSYNFRTSSLE